MQYQYIMGGGSSPKHNTFPLETQRNSNIVILRAIAILVVVLGHSIIIFDANWANAYGYSHSSKSEFLSVLKQLINMFQMELFFSLSGFCLYYSRKKLVTFFPFIKSKISRLLIPFLFVAILWLIPIRLLVGYPKYLELSFWQILTSIFTLKDVGHLWFLPVLFSLFVLSYPLLLLGKYNRYLPVLVAILLFAIHPIFRNPLVRNSFHYLFFFLFGYLINSLNVFNTTRTLKIFILVALVSMLAVGIIIIPELMGNKWFALTLSVAIVVAFYIFSSYIPYSHIWSHIDRNSFGIYLFHSPILYIGMTYLTFLPPAIYVPVQFCTSIAISWLIVDFLRRIRLNFFIGEKNGK